MASKKNVTWKCPFCDKRFDREKLVIHVDDKHQEEIPEGFTALRYVFHYVNKRPLDYHGRCTECKGPTPWDEEVGRYKRQCGKKECHDSYVKRFEENMIKKKGYTRETSTQEGLERMLKNRKISGSYTFQNGKKKDYVGSYEKKCLEFMDKVMNIDPDDILSPGPVLEYKFDGKTHYYISDFYYQPYNLVIEVKDGGDNPNTRNMEEYRRKQIAKEEYIIKHTNYNYLRLTNNDFAQLMSVFADLKMQLVDNSKDRVVHVNEATSNISYKKIYYDISEGYIFSKGNLEINLDKWGIGTPLWICGSSGDGKSTLANKLAKENEALICHTDLLLIRISWPKEKWDSRINNPESGLYKMKNGDPGYKYILQHSNLPWNIGGGNYAKYEVLEPYFLDFFKWLIKECVSGFISNKMIIVEGCDIWHMNPDYMASQPLIILNNPRLKSLHQRAKRYSVDSNYIRALFKELKNYKSTVKPLDDQRDIFYDKVNDIIKEEAVFNEFMNALTSGYFPGYEDCDAYICTADYMQNNVFANCGQNFFAIASDPGLHNLIYVNNEGVLTSSSLEEFDKTYPGVIDHVNIFALKVPMSGIHNALANYIGKVLDREGMYYSVFKEHLYSIDQVRFSDKVLGEVNNEISDFNTIYGMTKGTLVYNESDMIPKGNNTYYNYRDGKTYMRSEINPDFFVETTSPKNKVFMEQILLGGMVNNG